MGDRKGVLHEMLRTVFQQIVAMLSSLAAYSVVVQQNCAILARMCVDSSAKLSVGCVRSAVHASSFEASIQACTSEVGSPCSRKPRSFLIASCRDSSWRRSLARLCASLAHLASWLSRRRAG